MTDLADLVDALKRRVAPPGEFDDTFPDSTDDDLTGRLADAFGECQLDGYFNAPAYTLNPVDLETVTPDLVPAEMALIILYAAASVVTSQLGNVKSSITYKAGTAEYQVQQAATVLTAVLKVIQDQKNYLRTRQALLGTSSAFIMADQYLVKAIGPYTLGYGGYVFDSLDHAYDYAGNQTLSLP